MKNLLLFIISVFCFYGLDAKEEFAHPGIEPPTNIGSYLNTDGTLNLCAGFTGSFDLTGYQVTLDDCKGIKATPLDEAPMTSSWSALDSGLDGTCYAITIDAGGNIYAGGSFTLAGGITVNNIAMWDGSNWSALGSGLDNTCRAIAIDASGNIYAGGFFTSPGNYIAKWDGSTWSTLGTGFNNFCYCIAIDAGGDVYAGGAFTTAGGTAVWRIAKWDGSAWSNLGYLHSTCVALIFDSSGNMYAGGSFTTAGSVNANEIAKWDGSVWSTLGTGLDCQCTSLALDASENVIAGGCFTTAGGIAANNIAKWDVSSSTWSALGSGLGNNSYGVAVDGSGNIYAGGTFTTAGGNAANYIAMWDGTTWSTLDSGLDAACYATTIDNNGNLYAGGSFTTAGGNSANGIALWGDAPLPVELLDFKGVSMANAVQLNWGTASEVNNEGFQIEHSLEGNEWESLDFIRGNGSSSVNNHYEYLHQNPIPKSNYYRLKQIDYDGSFEYSNVIQVFVRQKEEAFRISPNPVKGDIHLFIDQASIEKRMVSLFNTQGKILYKQILADGATQISIDSKHLFAGIYFLTVNQNKKTIWSEKVIIPF